MGNKLKEHFDGQLANIREEDGEWEEKISTLGPLFLVYEREMTEYRFRQILTDSGINYLDPVVERGLAEYMNKYHFGGIFNITERCEDTWLDEGSEMAFFAVTNEDWINFVTELREEADEFRKYIILN